MKRPEHEVIRAMVCHWLSKARTDVRAAEALLGHVPPLLFPSSFHSQQAAEKFLKAYLTRWQVEFPKTHSIRQLLDFVRTVDAALADALQETTALTPYGVEIRYPRDEPEPDVEETARALELARSVGRAVESRLADCVGPDSAG